MKPTHDGKAAKKICGFKKLIHVFYMIGRWIHGQLAGLGPEDSAETTQVKTPTNPRSVSQPILTKPTNT